MAWTKIKTAVVVGVSLIVVAGTVTVTTVSMRKTPRIRPAAELAKIPWQAAPPGGMFELLDRYPAEVNLLPSAFDHGFLNASFEYSNPDKPDKWTAIGLWRTPEEILRLIAGGRPMTGTRTVVPPDMPGGHYDFIANQPEGSQAALAELVQKQFGLRAHHEMRETDVLFLTVKQPNAPGLRSGTAYTPSGTGLNARPGYVLNQNESIGQFATNYLEAQMQMPIVDHTGLAGTYDFEFTAPGRARGNPAQRRDTLKQTLLDDLGLELVPGQATIDMIVVEKVN